MLLAKAKKVQYHDVVRKAPEKKFFFAEKEPVLQESFIIVKLFATLF
jgi:hypothetical protein